MSRTNKQGARLLEALRRQPMTALEIWQDLGIARASARVFDLREAGWEIQSTEISVRNREGELCRVALYSLASNQMTLVPVHPGRGVLTA